MSVPSGYEQLMIELTNAFRLDPRGEYSRLIRNAGAQEGEDSHVTAALRFYDVDLRVLRKELAQAPAVQPLAWNARLQDAADGHTRAMIAADAQAHQLPGEGALAARIAAAGYDAVGVGENVFAFVQTPRHAHGALVIDWGPDPQGRRTADGMQVERGHRIALLEGRFAEIGVSVIAERDAATAVGPYVMTQNLALSRQAEPMLLGVAYADRDRDDFYSIGEGIDGARIVVAGRGVARTADAGGYALEAGEGLAAVALSGRGVRGTIRAEIEIGRENVKLDIVNGRHLMTSADLELISGGSSVTALGAGNIDLVGRGGRDLLIGNAGRNALSGESGSDRLRGEAGHDRLFGGDGSDRLEGGDGRDLLLGGRGHDLLWGGRGADRLDGEAGRDRLFGGDGADLLNGGRGDDRLDGGAGDDRLTGGDGRDRLTGGDGDDVLYGGSGRDRLEGERGDDRLLGEAGGDVLHGGRGDDRLVGGPGRDKLVGGPGDDVLRGGDGADQFAFGADHGRNRILDWEAEDRLLLLARGLGRDDARLSASGDHARVDFGDTIILIKDQAGLIDQDDFIF